MASTVEDFLVDFGQEEESGGGGVRVPEGTHHVKILKARPTVSAQKGTAGLEVTFMFLDGNLRKQKKKIVDTLWNSPKAYSRFRLLLQACGKRVPSKINASKMAAAIKGSELYVEIEDEAREGYDTRSRVGFRGFINPDDYDPNEDLDEDEEEEDLDEDIEDEEDEDLDDLEDEEEEEEEPEPPKRRRKTAAKKSSSTRRRRKPVEEEEDDEDEEEEDEEPAPRRKRAAAKKSSSRKRKASDDEEEDDLSNLDLDDM